MVGGVVHPLEAGWTRPNWRRAISNYNSVTGRECSTSAGDGVSTARGVALYATCHIKGTQCWTNRHPRPGR